MTVLEEHAEEQRGMTKSNTTMTILNTIAILLVSMCLGAGRAAADTIFTNESSFITASGPLGFESFEGLTATNTETAPFSATLAAFTVSTPATSPAGVWNTPFLGDHATDGHNYIEINLFTPTITFLFNSPINKFGLTITDYGDFTASPLGFSTNAGATGTAAVGNRPDANEQFFGIIATNSFTSITFTGSDPYAVDGVRFGSSANNPVPEPASILLLGTGLVIAVAGKRRQLRTR
jgi:PEP-CTERM motif